MFKETIRGEYLMDEHNGNLLNKDVITQVSGVKLKLMVS